MLAEIWKNAQFENYSTLHRMRALMEEFCSFARSKGYEVQPYKTYDLGHFAKVPLQAQNQSYQNFLTFYKVCASASQKGLNLTEDHSLLWWAIGELGYRPCSDLFDKLQKGDVIEIYNKDFIQIFRNFEFFEICSYSLEEVFSYEWRELFQRDNVTTQKLAEQALSLFTGAIRSTIPFTGVGEHDLVEKFSRERNIIKVEHKYLSPLFSKDSGLSEAFVVTSRAEVVGHHQPLGVVTPFFPKHAKELSSLK